MVISSLPDYSTTPSLEGRQVYSPRARKEAGVGLAYVDQYNDSQLAQYNNEYNYWLWQQQAEYNSPANQMARAREAGLNPNVVAGNVSSGNLSSTPESKANYKSHIFENRMQGINTGLNAFNAVLGAVKDGIQSVSALSGIPDDISTYRHLLSSSAYNDWHIKQANEIAKNLENIQKGYITFGSEYPNLHYRLLGDNNMLFGNLRGEKSQQYLLDALNESMFGKGLLNAFNRADLTNKKITADTNFLGNRKALIDAQIKNLGGRTELTADQKALLDKQLQFFDSNQIMPWILNFLSLIAKLL